MTGTNKVLKGLNIKIGADTVGLDTALKDVEKNCRKSATELREVDRALKTAPDSVELWKQKQELLKKSISDTRDKLKTLESAQADVNKQFNNGQITEQQYRAFQREIETTRGSLQNLESQFRETGVQALQMGGNLENLGGHAETSELQAALRDVEKNCHKSASELREVNKALKTAPNSVELWKQKQELLKKSISETRDKLKTLESAQADVKKQFQNGQINEQQYRAFQREIETTRGSLRNLESQLSTTNFEIFQRETENTRGSLQDLTSELRNSENQAEQSNENFEELENQLNETGNQAEKSSSGFTVMKGVLADLVSNGIQLATSALKDFTKSTVQTGMSFESSISSVKAISGATEGEIEKLTEKAKEMGATTKYTASQSADAFQYMALAGWKTEDMLSGIDGILSLASASNMDLARASDIVTDYLTAFGLTAQDSEKFVDQMTYAMSNSNTTTELLGEAYKTCASTAKSMHYSVEDVTAVLMTMANAGVKGGEAGTALNAVMTRLATDTKGCATALSEYGVQVYDSEGNMQSLASILQGVQGVWETLTDQQQANLAKIIAGTSQYSALQTIMAGLSDTAKESGQSFEDYAQALEQCDGTAEDMSKTMLDNLSGDLTIFESAVDGMKISIADELNPALRDIVQYATKKVPDVQKVIKPLFETAIDGAKKLIDNLPKAVEIAKKIIPVVTGIGGAVATLKIADLISKLPALASGIKMVSLAISANPYVAAATAVIGLATAIGTLVIAKKNEKTELEKITEENDREIQSLKDNQQAVNDLNRSFDESAGQIKAESDRTRELWEELDKLADANGVVHDKDKARAEYILNELNDALGTEFTMVGNQIDNYKELSSAIDDVIAKKQAEAMLDSYLSMSGEMAEKRSQAREDYAKAKSELSDAVAEREKVEQRWRIARETGSLQDGETAENLYNQYLIARENESTARNKVLITKNTFLDADSYFERLANAQEAYSEGMYYSVEKILYQERKVSDEVLDGTLTDMESRVKAFEESLQQADSDLELAVKSGTEKAMKEAGEMVNQTMELAKISGQNVNKVWSENFGQTFKELAKNGIDISEWTKWAKDSGTGVATVFGATWREDIQKQIDSGFDVADLLEWCYNSGVNASEIFGDEFISYIQSRLDGGFDVKNLLAWGAESGYNVSSVFSDEYVQKYQQTLDDTEQYNINDFLYWAEVKGIDIGTLFGENYQHYVNDYLGRAETDYTNHCENLKETTNSWIEFFHGSIREAYEETMRKANDIKQAINDAISDINPELPANLPEGAVPVRRYATGGFIHSGQAIVAEAGPELLEIMNNGVKVTPLSANSKGIPVGKSGNQQIFYNNYTVNAVVSNDYDVRKLAENLETERRRISMGGGISP